VIYETYIKEFKIQSFFIKNNYDIRECV
jgi:hypothetical protein